MGAQEREESMQKSRKVHPFEKRLRLLEEALEQKMDKRLMVRTLRSG
jgi:hypothetical protein